LAFIAAAVCWSVPLRQASRSTIKPANGSGKPAKAKIGVDQQGLLRVLTDSIMSERGKKNQHAAVNSKAATE